jgi:hypothetical protein
MKLDPVAETKRKFALVIFVKFIFDVVTFPDTFTVPFTSNLKLGFLPIPILPPVTMIAPTVTLGFIALTFNPPLDILNVDVDIFVFVKLLAVICVVITVPATFTLFDILIDPPEYVVPIK